MPTITITFSPGEATKVKAAGFAGGACLKATAPYEKVLGGEVVKRTETAEARSSTRANKQLKQQGTA